MAGVKIMTSTTLLYKSWQYRPLRTLDTEIFLTEQSKETVVLSFTNGQPKIVHSRNINPSIIVQIKSCSSNLD